MSWGLLSVVITLGAPQQANGGGGGEVVNDGGDRPGGERLRHWQGGRGGGLTVGEAGCAAPASPHPCGYQAIGTAPPRRCLTFRRPRCPP